MPYFSKPLNLIKGSLHIPSFTTTSQSNKSSQSCPSFAVPPIPPVSSTSPSSQPSSPNVRNFSPSPGKLLKMDFVQNPHHITNTTLEEISRKQNEILHFLAHAAHNVEQGKYLDSDVSTISSSSMSTTSRKSSNRSRRRNQYRRKQSKAKTSTMHPVKEENIGNMP